MSDELARKREERSVASRQEVLEGVKDMRRRIRKFALAAGEDDEDALALLRQAEQRLQSDESPTRLLVALTILALDYCSPAVRLRMLDELEQILRDAAAKPPASMRELRAGDT